MRVCVCACGLYVCVQVCTCVVWQTRVLPFLHCVCVYVCTYVCGGGTCDTQRVSSPRAAADQAAVDCVCLREKELLCPCLCKVVGETVFMDLVHVSVCESASAYTCVHINISSVI